MSLTNEQDKAIKAIEAWRTGGSFSNWKFTLKGFAGTGKTFLLQHLINNLDNPPVCCTPTGKAASVLASKLQGVEVKTIHSTLYRPQAQDESELQHILSLLQASPGDEALKEALRLEKERLAKEDAKFFGREDLDLNPGGLIIVDEASMVTEYMLNDFQRTGCKVLFVGDDGQLPPVKDSGAWFFEEEDARLIEVQRQAKDNPIIRLSMMIREGQEDIARFNFDYEDCCFRRKDDVDKDTWLSADQTLTGYNNTRQRINRFIRKQRGYNASELPVAGEKLICLKNDYGMTPMAINGVQFDCLSDATCEDEQGLTGYISMVYEGVPILDKAFYPYHCWNTYREGLQEEPREWRSGLLELDFGHCITVHKSQGSEWDFVILADGDNFFGKNPVDRRRWLYTAVTRARKKLLIVRP